MAAPRDLRMEEGNEEETSEQQRYTQLREDVLDGYVVLGKNTKTVKKHTKTLGKHGTSLRWIKRTQADHTVRLQRIEDRLDGLEGRFDGLEAKVDGLEGRFDGLEGRFDGLEGRFDGLEAKVDGQFQHLQSQLNTVIGLLGGRRNDHG